jgi:hypothetical protein
MNLMAPEPRSDSKIMLREPELEPITDAYKDVKP